MVAVSPFPVRGPLLSSVVASLSSTSLPWVPRLLSGRVAAAETHARRAVSRPYHSRRRDGVTPPQPYRLSSARLSPWPPSTPSPYSPSPYLSFSPFPSLSSSPSPSLSSSPSPSLSSSPSPSLSSSPSPSLSSSASPSFFSSLSSSPSSSPESVPPSWPRLSDSELSKIFQAAAAPRAATGEDSGSLKRRPTVPANRLFKALLRSGLLDRDLGGVAQKDSKTAPAIEFGQLCEFYEQGRFYDTWGGGAQILKISGVRGLAPPGGNLKGGIIDSTPKCMNYEEFRTFVQAVRVWLRDKHSPVPLSGATMKATGSSTTPGRVVD
ncbi:hypothetical protein NCLIV_006205 [Neospora caninum Liverpool]|uniref:Uncharacterized protein n=1 Tax=Neospora caninum (strain Liverpool) TaxID=572307 RepID=F0V8V4_NEOCL|nr:hypothetical protein NCLIV_006205 [Neospora caninum Liverpool]CBZ50145.1 hypothetical protein NCLIV_006205 [Neospora caninum Liverpool]CEL64740.1 TPA: hypothetical protein BN1204_006205 [Neospora caninum Liverpool]|eukprot:XP_003880180.1 hypothetical protein NCLIV_006205 [Neospora caninum Liverpool]